MSVYIKLLHLVWIGANDREEENVFVWDHDNSRVSENIQLAGSIADVDCVQVSTTGALIAQPCLALAQPICMPNNSYQKIDMETYINDPDPQWFGEKDMLVCHCRDCPSCRDGLCRPGWFGMNCLYRDLALRSNVLRSTVPELTDGNDQSCYHGGLRSLELDFKDKQTFTWLRIVVGGEWWNYSLQFEVNRTREQCQGQTYIVVDGKTRDFFCRHVIHFVAKVFLFWETNHPICSVYVSGGRNTALKRSLTQGPAMFAVDGKKTQPCFNSAAQKKSISLRFERPQLIHEIILDIRPRYLLYENRETVAVDCWGEANTSLVRYTNINLDNSGRLRLMEVLRKALMRIDVIITSNMGLQMCEIEVYGDCSMPVYGLYCSDICSMGCFNQHCHYNGLCYYCEDGRKGNYCIEGDTSNFKWYNEGKNSTDVPAMRRSMTWFLGSDLVLFIFYIALLVHLAAIFLIFLCCRCFNSPHTVDQSGSHHRRLDKQRSKRHVGQYSSARVQYHSFDSTDELSFPRNTKRQVTLNAYTKRQVTLNAYTKKQARISNSKDRLTLNPNPKDQ
ncbi:uncharacterized protein LOC131943469, partial [Physella acuta]|uniref:uncharacterized protein LOC131943469 n=1 Tax=Physella acuta TaxID=109671 RepID=UPI0027DCBC2D